MLVLKWLRGMFVSLVTKEAPGGTRRIFLAMSGIEHASTRSIRPFRSCEEYLYAMKEDLAEWLKDLYGVEITVSNMVQVLETGALLCAHANNVTRAAADFQHKHGRAHAHLPTTGVIFTSSAQPGTFLARDNVSNFITWCRNEMHIKGKGGKGNAPVMEMYSGSSCSN